jgi:hypothetical protein
MNKDLEKYYTVLFERKTNKRISELFSEREWELFIIGMFRVKKSLSNSIIHLVQD